MEQTYKKLLTYAYNITGCYEDAKDMVQDVLEKFIAVDKSRIVNENSYLLKSVIHTSLSFRKRQERQQRYGVWLPDPVATDDPECPLLREQTAGYTLLVLMQQLDARERAVFILKEGFDYRHEEIAELLDISTENSLQLLTRSRKTLRDKRFKPATPTGQPVMDRYIRSLTEADMEGLQQLLLDDIQLMADGGHKVKVIKDMMIGREATAGLLQYVFTLFLHATRWVFTAVNHQPAICFYKQDRLYACQIMELDTEGRICNIYSVIDPEKLHNLEQQV